MGRGCVQSDAGGATVRSHPTKAAQLRAEKDVVNWLRTINYACQLAIISAAALQITPPIIAAIGILSLVVQYRVGLYTDAAVDTALSVPVPKPPNEDDPV